MPLPQEQNVAKAASVVADTPGAGSTAGDSHVRKSASGHGDLSSYFFCHSMGFLSRKLAPQTLTFFKLQLFHHVQVSPDHKAAEDPYEIYDDATEDPYENHDEAGKLLLELCADLELQSSDQEPEDAVKEEKDDQQSGEEPEEQPGDEGRARSSKRRRSSPSSSRSRSRYRRRSQFDKSYDWKKLCGSNTIIFSLFYQPTIRNQTLTQDFFKFFWGFKVLRLTLFPLLHISPLSRLLGMAMMMENQKRNR